MDWQTPWRGLHGRLERCRACPKMAGTPVHGAAVRTNILLIGQAPGPREASFGKPFAWTAGRTLFRWFEEALGAGEEEVRAKIYFAAVARCFPGKAKGGGDRRPDAEEIERCGKWLEEETALLKPRLVIPVGGLAIEQVLGHKGGLAEIVGRQLTARYRGLSVEVIPLPHPSGASTWHRMSPGKELLQKALGLLAEHPSIRRAFPARASRTG